MPRFCSWQRRNQVRVLRIARFVVWTCFLEVLWAIFVGTTQSTELIAGLIAAAVVALFVEVLRAHDLLGFRSSRAAFSGVWTIPGHVLYDFVLVFRVLLTSVARGRRVRGTWIEAPFEAEAGAKGRFRRALAVALENESANGIVVDLDDGRALLHSLDTSVTTGRSIL
jgi:hypothetical protein